VKFNESDEANINTIKDDEESKNWWNGWKKKEWKEIIEWRREW
jgi:hypothetical protein